ncbi:phosphate ABC transporter permease subunit PstC [Psychromonas sp. MB-3u-54]|uniref:phosphate ABC transporter permease subunit PstC n=1 Tax=Psychromonas sp. MB-3u-54 TaxID=2058319 RepID=UPI000C3248B5|nr:phosphate ABC transporter permease subunit PstC [Psychromonas sp. MB-3u-54]PKH02081.1 phosphate ABC transporter permease subunit PstC [Psychromonas sp. MB-3u-54]
MTSTALILIITLLTLGSYWVGMQRSIKVAGGVSQIKNMHSLPQQFGLLTAFCCGLPALFLLLLWGIVEPIIIQSLLVDSLDAQVQALSSADLSLYLNDIRIMADSTLSELSNDGVKQQAALYLQVLKDQASILKSGLILITALASVMFIASRFKLSFSARALSESVTKFLFLSCSVVAIFTTLGILMSVLFESLQFFKSVSSLDFLFGTTWSPQIAMRSDQVGSSGAFGAVPLFAGTMLISFIAMTIAAPVGLLTAIYLSQYASPTLRTIAKPMLEILAGIPTVVYGFFAALTVAPFIRDTGEALGLNVASESALAAGIVMGVMIIPFVSSLSDDALNAVPKALKEGSLAMGATESETIKKILLPAALPGIIGAMLLAVSRAIGETMIVVMAAGMAANLTANPLAAVTTVTVQIVTLLTGDQEFDSPKTLAAFALGLMLFVTTLLLNVIALKVVRKYREQYD